MASSHKRRWANHGHTGEAHSGGVVHLDRCSNLRWSWSGGDPTHESSEGLAYYEAPLQRGARVLGIPISRGDASTYSIRYEGDCVGSKSTSKTSSASMPSSMVFRESLWFKSFNPSETLVPTPIPRPYGPRAGPVSSPGSLSPGTKQSCGSRTTPRT